jgi:pyruvate dehydrogenase E1 component alpha subunit
MKTPVHLCIGQEAIAAGVCINLNKDDYIFSTHRNHGHYIAKGAEIKFLMAELYGKLGGCSKGKGGSMHTVAPEYGMLGTTAIVGGNIGLAAGAALASKIRRDGKVSVAFFGDGAVDEGVFHEALNFAALKKLAVVFVCENNFYSINSPQSARHSQDNIAKKSASYGISGIQVDGNDVQAVFTAAKEAIGKARRSSLPALIECRTYRWCGHVGPEYDYKKGCRPKEELQKWMAKCPIENYKQYLFRTGLISDSGFQNMLKEIDGGVEEALNFARQSPFPEKSQLFDNLYYQGV